jgi:drug/metabolite transporter (DMT)-like permease
MHPTRRLGAISSVPDRSTVLAFIGIVVLGGVNGVAVRFSNHELAPFWGAAVRFGLASAVLFGAVVIRRVPMPRGAALTGSVLYGLLGFAGAFGFIYWGLVATPAGLGQIILALVPLLTFLFAVAERLEGFRWQSLVGALVAIAGIAVVFGDRVGAAVPLASMLAIVAAAACMAQSNVVVKRYPKCHPVANNAIAMGVGGAFLLLLSLVLDERHALPVEGQTVAAIGYLSLIGSVGVFSLFLYVISRWSASATSYVMLLMPLVTVAVAATLANEAVTAAYFVGGALVLGGVYLGAFAPSLGRTAAALVGRGGTPDLATAAGSRPEAPVGTAETTEVGIEKLDPPRPPTIVLPGCA